MKTETLGATVITNLEASSLRMFYVFRFLLSSKSNFFHFKTLLYIFFILGYKYTPIHLQATLKIEATTSSETLLITWLHGFTSQKSVIFVLTVKDLKY
jgi:hypothetical protein